MADEYVNKPMDPDEQTLNEEEDVPQIQTSTNAPVTDPPPSKSGEEQKKGGTKYYPKISIDIIYDQWPIWTLVDQIEENLEYDKLLTKARVILDSLQGWLLKSPTFDPSDFSSKILECWEDSCFVDGVRLAIEEAPRVIITDIFCFSKGDSSDDRLACMESDISIKDRLQEIQTKPDTSTTTILRLFLSILIAHWTDHDVLLKLDVIMKEPYFRKEIDLINRVEAGAAAYKERNVRVEHLLFNMDGPGDTKDLREKLTEKYPEGQQDIEAIVTRIKGQLDFMLEVHKDHSGYDGGNVTVKLRGFDGWYNVATIGMNVVK